MQAVTPLCTAASAAAAPDCVLGANGPSRRTSTPRSSAASDRAVQRRVLDWDVAGPAT